MRAHVVLSAALLFAYAGAYVAADAVVRPAVQQWSARELQARGREAAESFGAQVVDCAHGPQGSPCTLLGLGRDSEFLSLGLCTHGGVPWPRTAGFPAGVECATLLAGARELADGDRRLNLEVHPSRAGRVVVALDTSWGESRWVRARHFLRALVFFLGVVSLAAAWVSFRMGLGAARTAGGTVAGERPEAETGGPSDSAGGAGWNAERLRSAVSARLGGQQVLVASNREPWAHVRQDDGQFRAHQPASGLVTALEPVLQACGGTWVAHGSGNADREVVDATDGVPVPPAAPAYRLRRLWLSPEEVNGYYDGFANEGLWPLFHIAHARPEFRKSDFETFVSVNQRFADALCAEARCPDPVVLVQDYHLALVPRLLRARLPRATIVTFWHVPWPHPERVGICPWAEELVRGMLGSDLLGFHTQQHCNNFLDTVDRQLEARTDRERQAVVLGDVQTSVRAYPISIPWPPPWAAELPSADEARRAVRSELGLAADSLVGLGVDRLDYTKGVEERLGAVDALLRRHPEFRGRFTFVQLAAPSRTTLPRYKDLLQRVTTLCEEVNGRWGHGTYRPVVLVHAHHDQQTLGRCFRAADACYVSSLHDGMNLVAKEFVAAREDEQGVLVLSEFTGASRDLEEALIVNPYDVEGAGDALATALRMSADEQRLRMRALRATVAQHNVFGWAGRMLGDAATLRDKRWLRARWQAPAGKVFVGGEG